MTLLEPIINYLLNSGKRQVSLRQVVDGSGRERKQVLRVMDKLTREGYLEQVADQPEMRSYRVYGPDRRNPVWKIVNNLDDRPKPNPPRKQSYRSRVWKAIRVKRTFTKKELVVLSGASGHTVDELVRQLEKKGYVRRATDLGGKVLRADRSVLFQLVKRDQVDFPTGLFGGGS